MLQKDRCGGIVDDEQGRVRTEWGRTVRKEAVEWLKCGDQSKAGVVGMKEWGRLKMEMCIWGEATVTC